MWLIDVKLPCDITIQSKPNRVACASASNLFNNYNNNNYTSTMTGKDDTQVIIGNDIQSSGDNDSSKDGLVSESESEPSSPTFVNNCPKQRLMKGIQTGIQYAVTKNLSKPKREPLLEDFFTVDKTIIGGDDVTSPNNNGHNYTFTTYAPTAFLYFRHLFQINPNEFLESICSTPLQELHSLGASSSLFYFSHDDEFVIKTVTRKERKFLQTLLAAYYNNLQQHPRTLLPKFFGLFGYSSEGKNMSFIVMNNLLPTRFKMHKKYDLKGSTYKRQASKKERNKSDPIFKDLDFLEDYPEGIILEPETYAALVKTLRRDTNVLESFKIMDYSLLIGIHNLDLAASQSNIVKNDVMASKSLPIYGGGGTPSDNAYSTYQDPTQRNFPRSKSMNIRRRRIAAHSTALESIEFDLDICDMDDDKILYGGIPARSENGDRLLIFLGIIDILQSYRMKKKLEHTFKAVIHDGDKVSVHRPGFYAERFLHFICSRVFRKNQPRMRLETPVSDEFSEECSTCCSCLKSCFFMKKQISKRKESYKLYF